MEERRETTDINLGQCLRVLLKKSYWIVACALVGALLAFLYTWNFVTPTYRSDVKLYVNTSRVVVGEVQVENVTASSLTAAREAVKTYIEILKSRDTREQIRVRAGLDSLGNASISGSALNDTEILQVTVTDTDPNRAKAIANAVAEVLPERVQEAFQGTSVKVIDYAGPATPISLGYTRNIIIGVLAGVVLSVVIILWRVLANPFIQEEEMLTNLYGLPILSTIPNLCITHEDEHGHYYYSHYYKREPYAQSKDDSSTEKND